MLDPVSVATLLLIASVTPPEVPPPSSPAPAVTAVISPDVASCEIVTAPFEPVAIVISVPAIRS